MGRQRLDREQFRQANRSISNEMTFSEAKIRPPANKTSYFGPLVDLDQVDVTNSRASGRKKKAAPKGAA
jgi:hypothetical protein